jgi:hypothetical protein
MPFSHSSEQVLTVARLLMILLLALPLSACFLIAPTDSVTVPLPGLHSKARVEVWGNTFSEGRFEIVVTSPEGSARSVLWEDWGPAQRASLYLTPDNWLVVLGGGSINEMIEIPASAPPKIVPHERRPRDAGDQWAYLGAVDRGYVGGVVRLKFFSPSEQPECVPMYGEGRSPYRVQHQESRPCSSSQAVN